MGLCAMFSLETWISTLAYPLNIAGRPTYSWPAFIIPAYEWTILFSGLSACFGMLALNGLPSLYHPLFNAPNFRDGATDDKFFLCLESTDPKFDVVEARAYLESFGTGPWWWRWSTDGERSEIRDQGSVDQAERQLQARPCRRGSGLDCALAVMLGAAGCRQDMHNQPKIIPQRESVMFADHRSARPVIENTVARGALKEDSYFYTGVVTGANGYREEKDLLPFPATMAVLQKGEERFNIYCTPCHSRVGNGLGAIVLRGYKPAGNLNDQVRRAQPISHYFYVMTHGYGAMPDYSAQLAPEERWAVAAYIRAIQLSQNATTADVPSGAKVESLKDLAVAKGLPEGYSPARGICQFRQRSQAYPPRRQAKASRAWRQAILPIQRYLCRTRARQTRRPIRIKPTLRMRHRPRLRGIKEQESGWHTLLTPRYYPPISRPPRLSTAGGLGR